MKKNNVILITREEARQGAEEELESKVRALGALSEMLLNNAGGLTEETVQEIGDMIACSANSIEGTFGYFFKNDGKVVETSAAAAGGKGARP